MENKAEDALLFQLIEVQKQQNAVIKEEQTFKNTRVKKKKIRPEKSRWILVLNTGIAGLYYHGFAKREDKERLLGELTPGTQLILEREPKNKYDPWAILVLTQEQEVLGYVTKYKNETIARLMDAGKKFQVFVNEAEKGNLVTNQAQTENYEIPISVYMEDAVDATDYND